MNENSCRTLQTHNREIINILLTSSSQSVPVVSYGSSFFSLRFMARTLRTWAIDWRGKNLIRNLWYRPRTRLVRGIYFQLFLPVSNFSDKFKLGYWTASQDLKSSRRCPVSRTWNSLFIPQSLASQTISWPTLAVTVSFIKVYMADFFYLLDKISTMYW